LAIGEAPRFAVTSRPVDTLSDEVLSSTRVIIFDDVSPADTTAARLKRFVENGGGILVVNGPQASWPGSAADLLPATAAAAIDRSRTEGTGKRGQHAQPCASILSSPSVFIRLKKQLRSPVWQAGPAAFAMIHTAS